MNIEWQRCFKNIALAASEKSKDASSKVGAVLIRPDMTIASLGFNGFPKRMTDDPLWLNDPKYRTEKYRCIVHAEKNALRLSRDHTTEGYQLVVTRHPCEVCALDICSTDISDVWYIPHDDFENRWADSLAEARELFRLCGINLHRIIN